MKIGQDIHFLPLGACDSIGASCYFLKLGSSNIILDCGTRNEASLVAGPDFYPLLYSGFVHSLNEISQVFISHAHADHVGYLAHFLSDVSYPPVYMTAMTKGLMQYQLFGKGEKISAGTKLDASALLSRISPVGYLEQKDFGDYSVRFLQAGHIPGAMMTLFEYKGRSILYTGDYSFDDSLLAGRAILPKDLKVDVLIMCATHACHPSYYNKDDSLRRLARKIVRFLDRDQSVFFKTNQLSKGVELLAALNRYQEEQGTRYPIYLDSALISVVEYLEQAKLPLIREGNRVDTGQKKEGPYISLVQHPRAMPRNGEIDCSTDFSLHDDFDEMKAFIRELAPKTIFVVHYDSSNCEESIEDTLLWEPDFSGQFIFTETGKTYSL